MFFLYASCIFILIALDAASFLHNSFKLLSYNHFYLHRHSASSPPINTENATSSPLISSYATARRLSFPRCKLSFQANIKYHFTDSSISLTNQCVGCAAQNLGVIITATIRYSGLSAVMPYPRGSLTISTKSIGLMYAANSSFSESNASSRSLKDGIRSKRSSTRSISLYSLIENCAIVIVLSCSMSGIRCSNGTAVGVPLCY